MESKKKDESIVSVHSSLVSNNGAIQARTLVHLKGDRLVELRDRRDKDGNVEQYWYKLPKLPEE